MLSRLVALGLTAGLALTAGCGRPLKSADRGGAPGGGDRGGVSFAAMVDGLDSNQNTALAGQQFWDQHHGRAVTWDGEVYEVKASRGRAEIYLANSSRPLYRGYNIILQTTDLQGAGKLRRGDRARFDGLPSRYSAHPGNPVVITLGNGRLLD